MHISGAGCKQAGSLGSTITKPVCRKVTSLLEIASDVFWVAPDTGMYQSAGRQKRKAKYCLKECGVKYGCELCHSAAAIKDRKETIMDLVTGD